jgi:hypothetical protein
VKNSQGDKNMATELKTITKLAKELAAKELENDTTVDQKEMLETLDAVAKLLEQRAGSNSQIKELATQVQALVASKKS